jgi:hypothetical protein
MKKKDKIDVSKSNAFAVAGIDLTKYQGSVDLIRIKTYPDRNNGGPYSKHVPVPPERDER